MRGHGERTAREVTFGVIQFAVLVQLPACLVFLLQAFASETGKQLAFSAICIAGLALARRYYLKGDATLGVGLIASTLLVSIGFWYGLLSERTA